MTGPAAGPPLARLVRVVLAGDPPAHLSPLIEADRAQAVADLAAENSFAPEFAPGPASRCIPGRAPPPIADPAGAGPFILHLSIQDGRLVFDIRLPDDAPLVAVGLALGPFRGLIKDYQILVDSHMKAVEEGRESRIQAIDMGRRGLHDEGARLLRQRLAGKIAIDFPTARRLFTLVCVLHQRR